MSKFTAGRFYKKMPSGGGFMPEFTAGGFYKKLDLAGQNLSGLSLERANFMLANLEGAKLDSIIPTGATPALRPSASIS